MWKHSWAWRRWAWPPASCYLWSHEPTRWECELKQKFVTITGSHHPSICHQSSVICQPMCDLSWCCSPWSSGWSPWPVPRWAPRCRMFCCPAPWPQISSEYLQRYTRYLYYLVSIYNATLDIYTWCGPSGPAQQAREGESFQQASRRKFLVFLLTQHSWALAAKNIYR